MEVDYYCAFWNSTGSHWVVEWEGDLKGGQVLCKVNHLTAFAVVESVKTPSTVSYTVKITSLYSPFQYSIPFRLHLLSRAVVTGLVLQMVGPGQLATDVGFLSLHLFVLSVTRLWDCP